MRKVGTARLRRPRRSAAQFPLPINFSVPGASDYTEIAGRCLVLEISLELGCWCLELSFAHFQFVIRHSSFVIRHSPSPSYPPFGVVAIGSEF
jgi:hypothetical protein